jgi:hypothetical protein
VVTWACKVRTAVPDPAQTWAPDLVKRNFKACRPGQPRFHNFTDVLITAMGVRISRVLAAVSAPQPLRSIRQPRATS